MSDIKIPDLTGKELKPRYGIPYHPTKYKDFQEQAEDARALKADAVNWQLPALFIVLVILALVVLLVLRAKRPPQP